MPIVNQHIEPNIAISTLTEPIDFETDIHQSLGELQEFISKAPGGKLAVVVDCLAISPRFSDIVIGMGESARPDSPLRHAGFEFFLVVSGGLLELMVEWFKQPQYGGVELKTYLTVEEGIAAAKGK